MCSNSLDILKLLHYISFFVSCIFFFKPDRGRGVEGQVLDNHTVIKKLWTKQKVGKNDYSALQTEGD